jgi:hypothetical protein
MIELEFKAHKKSMQVRSRVVQKQDADGTTVTTTEATEGIGDSTHFRVVLACHEAQREVAGLNIAAAANPRETVSDMTAQWAKEETEEEARLRAQFTLEERIEQLKRRMAAQFDEEMRKLSESYGRGDPACGNDPGSPPDPGSTTPG